MPFPAPPDFHLFSPSLHTLTARMSCSGAFLPITNYFSPPRPASLPPLLLNLLQCFFCNVFPSLYSSSLRYGHPLSKRFLSSLPLSVHIASPSQHFLICPVSIPQLFPKFSLPQHLTPVNVLCYLISRTLILFLSVAFGAHASQQMPSQHNNLLRHFLFRLYKQHPDLSKDPKAFMPSSPPPPHPSSVCAYLVNHLRSNTYSCMYI